MLTHVPTFKAVAEEGKYCLFMYQSPYIATTKLLLAETIGEMLMSGILWSLL